MLMELSVGNLRNNKEGIRCDRASVLGNPFPDDRVSKRLVVIEAFRKYLWLIVCNNYEPIDAAKKVLATEPTLYLAGTWEKKYPTRDEVIKELRRIRDLLTETPITLLCWCSPKACHCDVIIKFLTWEGCEKYLGPVNRVTKSTYSQRPLGQPE